MTHKIADLGRRDSRCLTYARTTTVASAVSLALLGLGHSSGALAQVAPQSADTGRDSADMLAVITVTAQRRSEDILKVPYNISAVSGQFIADLGIVDQNELMRSVTGVSTVDRGYRNAGVINGLTIRGLNTNRTDQGDMALSAVPTVSTYVNDTPIYANFLLKDLERVEVLRGPQGTLYGSGSLGGTVRYITHHPELGKMSGSVEAGIGQTEGSNGINWTIDGVLNVPIAESLALRVVAGKVDNAGIVDYPNVYQLDSGGAPVAPNGLLASTTQGYDAAAYRRVKDADWVHITYGRAELLFKPSDSFSALLTYARQSDDTGGRRATTPGSDGLGHPYGKYDNGAIQLEPSSRDVELASLEMNLDLGFATLTSSSSYYDHSGQSLSDNTGYYANQNRFYPGGWLQYYDNYPRPMAQADRRYGDRAFVQEVRLASNTTAHNKLDYVVGAYYQDQHLRASQASYLKGFKAYEDTVYGAPSFVVSEQDFNYERTQKFSEKAAFGELTVHVTDRWSLTGGLRHYQNSNSTNILNFWSGTCSATGNEASGFVCWYPRGYSPDFSLSQSDSGNLFKGNVSYQLSDHQTLYGTVSEGYRRGGSNIVPPEGSTFGENPAWQTYKPDKTRNYEVGFKGASGSIRYSLAAFYVDWKDIQIDTASTNWGFYVAQNGGAASSRGFEAELDGSLGRAWHYHLGYAYTDAKLDDPVLRPFPTGTGVYPVVGAAGTRLPGTPKSSVNAALEHSMTLSSRLLWTNRINVYYQSNTENSILTDNGTATSAFNAVRYQHTWDGFSVWGLSSTIAAERWSATVSVKNLFNEAGITGGFLATAWGPNPDNTHFTGNDAKVLISQPRTIGLSASYRF